MSEPVTKEDLDWLRAYAKCEVMDLFCSQPMPPYYRVRLLRLLDERYAAVARLGEIAEKLEAVLNMKSGPPWVPVDWHEKLLALARGEANP